MGAEPDPLDELKKAVEAIDKALHEVKEKIKELEQGVAPPRRVSCRDGSTIGGGGRLPGPRSRPRSVFALDRTPAIQTRILARSPRRRKAFGAE